AAAKKPAAAKQHPKSKHPERVQARSDNPRTRAAAERVIEEKAEKKRNKRVKLDVSPPWWAPVMVTLMILGLIWVVVTYLMAGQWPLPIGNWNLAVGMGLMLCGFFMTLNWR
ncbi:MAG: cell division protein CrgA, partial [Bowdeniella nasicola]|nr:cell division protein CrgA [Bowdeniella nasicola]